MHEMNDFLNNILIFYDSNIYFSAGHVCEKEKRQ